MVLCLLNLILWILRLMSVQQMTKRKPKIIYVPKAARRTPKPAWVRREVIRIKAWSPQLGCRKIADVFNQQFAVRRKMTVSKSYVARTLYRYRYDVVYLRQRMKHRTPTAIAKNKIWALDLTQVHNEKGLSNLVLGVIDHGTRACVGLSFIADKCSKTLLHELVNLFRLYGKPKYLRMDNEACLNSVLIRFALRLLGIRIQRTQPHCPWQNGRIERLFGTLKNHLSQIKINNTNDLKTKLLEFRAYYNHARPHQHLKGKTPAQLWNNEKPGFTAQQISLWDGQLNAWYFSPM